MSESAEAPVISLAERLKQRRQELGLSQAQAARELDVARTAYRLWEMEAAKPQPDRWRLISRWLGVSVTTMLLADELDDKTPTERASDAFDRVGLTWEDAISAPSEFFARAHDLIQEGVEKGFLTTDHAQALLSLPRRFEDEQSGAESEAWEPTRLYRQLRAGVRAPRESREAIAFILSDLPATNLSTAQLLVSELVTNSVKHGQQRTAARRGLRQRRGRTRDRSADRQRRLRPHAGRPTGHSLGHRTR